jgi:hypothetical protein
MDRDFTAAQEGYLPRVPEPFTVAEIYHARYSKSRVCGSKMLSLVLNEGKSL